MPFRFDFERDIDELERELGRHATRQERRRISLLTDPLERARIVQKIIAAERKRKDSAA